MTGNPFDPDDGDDWQVVVNLLGRHALWRSFLELPAGWRVVHSGTDRDGALAHVERHCSGPRPADRDTAEPAAP
ncbi:hypothetical protein SSP35_02_00980 [Streptomyces sp. NBRC 110611]|uniref:MbtH family NRPS accessory protein n=1 Tax=Streptomyces sp. NBRC 110611 TaxID=1621259 RepID=UPI00082C3832|nr:MbtH family NRPS accessory protein [Streptomyces sp. NBRC 110611]GAU65731.1 hypothetical protein SSP35_02_00980 [Streptomyces sp. NBRC 110611]